MERITNKHVGRNISQLASGRPRKEVTQGNTLKYLRLRAGFINSTATWLRWYALSGLSLPFEDLMYLDHPRSGSKLNC